MWRLRTAPVLSVTMGQPGCSGRSCAGWKGSLARRVRSWRRMPEMILLTGATGALGPHLAAELLAQHAGDHVSALVRSTAVSVQARFDRWVKTVCSIRGGGGAAWPPDPSRLHLAPGDIAEEGLGLAAAQRDA